jgi:hypothetical protein
MTWQTFSFKPIRAVTGVDFHRIDFTTNMVAHEAEEAIVYCKVRDDRRPWPRVEWFSVQDAALVQLD